MKNYLYNNIGNMFFSKMRKLVTTGSVFIEIMVIIRATFTMDSFKK